MFNLAQSEYKVSPGDRIAQLVLERILTPPVVEVLIRSVFCSFKILLFVLFFNFLNTVVGLGLR